MVSTFGSLNTVVTGLQSHQTRLATVGHNISNASTDGFSRQRVNVVAASSQRVYTTGGMAQLGLGVKLQSITRIRDTFVDRQYWRETPLYNTHKTAYSLLTKLEDVFGEPSDTGLESIMNTFWESMNAVSKEASNVSARAVVIEDGKQLANTVNQEAGQFFTMVKEVNDTIRLKVGSVNEITREIVALNKKITSIEAGGLDNANDLRDRRDWLVDNLSVIMDIQVTEDENGAFIVSGASGGSPLVTATNSYDLSTVSTIDADYGFEVVNVKNPEISNTVLNFKNGEMAALINFRDSTDGDGIKKYLNDLSNMSKFLLQEFNDIHKAGIDLNGNQGLNFFGTNGVDYNDPVTAAPVPPATVGFTKGDWIRNLKVNDVLADTGTGAFKLAVRTALGEAKQSNPQSGHTVLGYSGAAPAAFVQNLPPNAEIVVTIDSVAAAPVNPGDPPLGTVTGITCSMIDNSVIPPVVTTINATPINDPPDAGSYVFELDGALAGLTVQIARVASGNNTGDSYTFNVGDTPLMQGIAAGDNAINLCNRLKEDISATIGDTSLDTYYSTLIGVLGSQAKDAERMADNQKLVTDNLLELRESVCGVNQEEELTDMIRFQKAYDSASRILTAMDEMLDRLINGTGRVGA